MAKTARQLGAVNNGREIMPPKPGAHPMVFFIYDQMKAQGIGKAEMLRRAGVADSLFATWRGLQYNGRIIYPALRSLEAVLEVLGYRLTVERIEK